MIQTRDEYQAARDKLARRYRNAVKANRRDQAAALRESIVMLDRELARLA